MVVHLGIVGWQYCYTDAGCDPITRQWMRLYCPERLAADEALHSALRRGAEDARGAASSSSSRKGSGEGSR